MTTVNNLPPNFHEAIRTLGLVVCLAGCTASGVVQPGSQVAWDEFDGARALEAVEYQVSQGPRTPGSQAHRVVGDWIAATLQDQGWEVTIERHRYGEVEIRNVLARAGPPSSGGVLLGAHYDTRPRADRDAASPETPVPGANDGASGAAVLLELGRILPPADLQLPVTLAFFDAEDSGRIESWPWALGASLHAERAPTLPARAVIVDMVGDADQQIYFEANSDPALAGEIWQVAAQLGYDSFQPRVVHSLVDDHTPFAKAGIPAVLVIDFDYPYWHTTEDTPDKLSAESLQAVGRTLALWLQQQNSQAQAR